MRRFEERQMARVMGWRGSKAKRRRSYYRTEFVPQVLRDEQQAAMLAAREATTTTQE